MELTKKQAIELMMDGSKVSHKHLSGDEWMTIKNSRLIFKDGVEMSVPDFWEHRQGDYWKDGYYLIEK